MPGIDCCVFMSRLFDNLIHRTSPSRCAWALHRAGAWTENPRSGASFTLLFERDGDFHGPLLSWNMPSVNIVLSLLLLPPLLAVAAESDPRHMDAHAEKNGIVPYDVSKLTPQQQQLVKRAMEHWSATACITFVPRSNQVEYVNFTGKTDVGNNTSQVGYKKGVRNDVNITAFWWRQAEWMPAHELGHVLGLFHEHARWDRDSYLTVHYENIKPGREPDYDWVPKTNWLVTTTPYDYYSIMHYRVCWAGSCESQCKDGDGRSPCAVLAPVRTNFDGVIGQWDANKISALDGEKMRLIYGSNPATAPRDR